MRPRRVRPRYLKGKYPQLHVHEYDVKQHAALAEWLGQRNGVPIDRQLTAPVAFVGTNAMLGEEVNARGLEATLQPYLSTGSEDYWSTQADVTRAEASILERFQSFGALTVLAAGLIDGLNPCAFATIGLFISYLSRCPHCSQSSGIGSRAVALSARCCWG